MLDVISIQVSSAVEQYKDHWIHSDHLNKHLTCTVNIAIKNLLIIDYLNTTAYIVSTLDFKYACLRSVLLFNNGTYIHLNESLIKDSRGFPEQAT